MSTATRPRARHVLPFPSPKPQVLTAAAEIGGVVFTAVMEVWATEHADRCEHPHVLSPNSDGKRVFAWYFLTPTGRVVYPSREIPHAVPKSLAAMQADRPAGPPPARTPKRGPA